MAGPYTVQWPFLYVLISERTLFQMTYASMNNSCYDGHVNDLAGITQVVWASQSRDTKQYTDE